MFEIADNAGYRAAEKISDARKINAQIEQLIVSKIKKRK